MSVFQTVTHPARWAQAINGMLVNLAHVESISVHLIDARDDASAYQIRAWTPDGDYNVLATVPSKEDADRLIDKLAEALSVVRFHYEEAKE